MPSLGASFGRGAATMAQWDIANSDCIVVMGSNMAENHPVAFRFVVQAKQRGATVIHVDPRFTRTSALADIHAPIRAGSDIAFLGGIVRHLLEGDLWFREWALTFTNIAYIIEPGFTDAQAGDGKFSGWDEDTQGYKFDTWQPEGMVVPSALSAHYLNTTEESSEMSHDRTEGPPPTDPTLQHPNCVYQILKRQYAAYTPEMVERTTGCPRETFLKVCDALARNSGRDRTGAICYAVGWTHHTTGVQMIRASAIIQSLLGNVGRPGGGILALRGHASIQGSTDTPTLYNLLPGYIPQPQDHEPEQSLQDYLKAETMPTGWWHYFPNYFVSLLKAYYGDAATAANGFGFQWLPKIVGDHSQLPLTMAMADGTIRGMFMLGQNPVIGGSNADTVQRGLAKLEWLVVRDMAETETAAFWRKGRLVERGELRAEEIGTEVFLMPAALPAEKDGTVTNTHRLVQWHDKVVEAPGDSRSELWFMFHLGRRLRQLYAGSAKPEDEPIQALAWDYGTEGVIEEPSSAEVLREMNGYHVGDRDRQVRNFNDLKDDGSTACGNWLYSGIFPDRDANLARGRVPDSPEGPGTHLGWAFAWPLNRRTLYNRASADASGKPWSERKRLTWWDEGKGRWQGTDAIDFVTDKRPDYVPDWSKHPRGTDALSGADAFIMMADGKAAIFVSAGLKDGPLPTHYEPVESPVRNPLHPGTQHTPAAKTWARPDNPLHEMGDPRYPHVLTTYRLTEHHAGGIPTRLVPHLAELQPEGFAEIPTELAAELGIASTDWVVLSTARGQVETKALVTDRLRPFRIDGRRIYQLGMPWHFGWAGFAPGDTANALTAVVGDANTSMHENKALTCALRKGRLHPTERTPVP